VDNQPETSTAPRWLPAAEVLLTFLVFLVHGAWPVPEVNETHYLSKARHYWDPSWCASDFFCTTADAHQVFYWTFGWLSQLMSLPAMAWTGRVITYVLLALGWQSLSRRIVSFPLASVLSAGLLVVFNYRLHMAGEWIVGGVEAKGFAYALVFLGLAALVADRWNAALALFGAASAFHVLVGGWSVVAAGIGWLVLPGNRPRLASLLPGLVIGFCLALPGLIPAVLLTRGVDPDVVSLSNVIYVFERLPHHLVPGRFPLLFMLRFVALFIAWAIVSRWLPHTLPLARLRAFVIGSLAIAGVGAFVGWIPWYDEPLAAGLLRYYWFRTSDAMLPVGAALLVASAITHLAPLRPNASQPLAFCAAALIAWHLGDLLVQRKFDPRPLAASKLDNFAEYLEVCDWASKNLPAEAVVLTPRLDQTFRWYTSRGEVVNRKDIPQDAASIVQWHQRVEDVHRMPGWGEQERWFSSLALRDPQDLVRLGQKYGAKYLLTSASPPLPFELVSPANPSYAIYLLPESLPETRSTIDPTQIER